MPIIMNKLLGEYDNGNCHVQIWDDGTKARSTSDNVFKPEFAESVDLTVTEECNGECPYCYAGCTRYGSHMDLSDPVVQSFLKSLKPFTEAAINLNDMTWNELPVFLKMLKDKNVIVNGTINIKHINDNNMRLLKTWQRNRMLYGIGISVDDFGKYSDLIAEAMSALDNVVIHCIAGIVDEKYIKAMMNFQLRHRLKLLVLGYKKHAGGRAVSYYFTYGTKVDDNIETLKKCLTDIMGSIRVLAMDNLAIEQLDAQRLVDSKAWDSLYMGDEGEFTFFANMVKKKFGVSSMVPNREMLDLLPDAAECFKKVREISGHAKSTEEGHEICTNKEQG